jgi:hypothetical protein
MILLSAEYVCIVVPSITSAIVPISVRFFTT